MACNCSGISLQNCVNIDYPISRACRCVALLVFKGKPSGDANDQGVRLNGYVQTSFLLTFCSCYETSNCQNRFLRTFVYFSFVFDLTDTFWWRKYCFRQWVFELNCSLFQSWFNKIGKMYFSMFIFTFNRSLALVSDTFLHEKKETSPTHVHLKWVDKCQVVK